MDPRTASGKGAVSAWTAYKHLGVQELEDIKTAINWLKEKPYVDGSRIGMAGHSYGGYITSYAMTHCDLFAAGIAGAPVTDWRDYDSIYTERYMGLPAGQPRRLQRLVGREGRRQAARQAADPSRRDRRQRVAAKHHEVRRGPSRRQQGLRADDLSVVPPRNLRARITAGSSSISSGEPWATRNRRRPVSPGEVASSIEDEAPARPVLPQRSPPGGAGAVRIGTFCEVTEFRGGRPARNDSDGPPTSQRPFILENPPHVGPLLQGEEHAQIPSPAGRGCP